MGQASRAFVNDEDRDIRISTRMADGSDGRHGTEDRLSGLRDISYCAIGCRM